MPADEPCHGRSLTVLRKRMHLSKEEFETFKGDVRKAARSYLDMDKAWHAQRPEDRKTFFRQVLKKYEVFNNKFKPPTWPIEKYVRKWLGNTSFRRRAGKVAEQQTRDEAVGPNETVLGETTSRSGTAEEPVEVMVQTMDATPTCPHVGCGNPGNSDLSSDWDKDPAIMDLGQYLSSLSPRLKAILPNLIRSGIRSQGDFLLVKEWPDDQRRYLLRLDAEVDAFSYRLLQVCWSKL